MISTTKLTILGIVFLTTPKAFHKLTTNKAVQLAHLNMFIMRKTMGFNLCLNIRTISVIVRMIHKPMNTM